MPRLVSYRISDRDDGRFDVVATIEPGPAYRREGFASLGEAEDWIEGLRVLMAAIGAPVALAPSVDRAVMPHAAPQRRVVKRDAG